MTATVERSRDDSQHYFVARVMLESESAFAISSGLTDSQFDNLLVRDANGLPAIPGTSLAGVLRHLYQRCWSATDNIPLQAEASADRPAEPPRQAFSSIEDRLFGFQQDDSGAASALQVSWGCIHDQHNKPVDTLMSRQAIDRDKLLNRLALDHPASRERVRIDGKGASANMAKYDITLLPTGCRFTFELALWWDAADTELWLRLLGLFSHPLFRIGGSTRSGLGRFKATVLDQCRLNLGQPDDYKKYVSLPVALSSPWPPNLHNAVVPAVASASDFVALELRLTPEDFWRFGQGDAPLPDRQLDKKHLPDQVPVVEPIVQWNGEPAFTTRVLAPASGFKGALRHRALFHLRRILQRENTASHQIAAQSERMLDRLFGCAADESSSESKGMAGRLLIEDCYSEKAEPATQILWHSSIDRYTGGVRDTALYSEQMVWREPLISKLVVDLATTDENPAEAAQMTQTLEALRLTFDDLCNGMLALGAGDARGHGYFSGQFETGDASTLEVASHE